MRRCVIVGAAAIGDYEAAGRLLRPEDFFVFCDGGLRHQAGLGAAPDLIVGDFDSHPRPETEEETIVLPREKDDTDTAFAVKEALRRGFSEFLLLGAAGGRLDHTLGNLALLLLLDSRGAHGVLADDWSEAEIVSHASAYVEAAFPYFSLLALDGPAEGVTVTGAKYPLQNAVIPCDEPYGISNEVLPGGRAKITVARGRLLLVRVRRDPKM